MTGTSDSYLGGFVGVNLGSIEQSFTTATASVTGIGNRDVIGGFVGANFGSIDASSAAGNATGTTDSAVGAFAGANATFVNFSVGAIPNSSFPDGHHHQFVRHRHGQWWRRKHGRPVHRARKPDDRCQPAGVSLDHLWLHRSHMRVREAPACCRRR